MDSIEGCEAGLKLLLNGSLREIFADGSGEVGTDGPVTFGVAVLVVPDRLQAQTHGMRIAIHAHPVGADLTPERMIARSGRLGFIAHGNQRLDLADPRISQLDEAIPKTDH